MINPLKTVAAALRELRDAVKDHPDFQKRDLVGLGIQVTSALALAEREDSVALFGSDFLPGIFTFAGSTIQLGDVVRQAFVDSELTPAAWNRLHGLNREKLLLEAAWRIRSKCEAEADPNPPWREPS